MSFDKKSFLEDWDKRVEKTHDDFRRDANLYNHDKNVEIAQEHAKEYAQMAIKHLFFINGGALVALPAIIGAFELTKSSDLWISGLSYCVGLVCIVLTSLFSYFSMVSSIAWMNADKYKKYDGLFLGNLREVMASQSVVNFEKNVEGYKNKFKWGKIKSTVCEVSAIALGFISLASFIFGTYSLTNVVFQTQNAEIEGKKDIINQPHSTAKKSPI